jgi:hypothetical protein
MRSFSLLFTKKLSKISKISKAILVAGTLLFTQTTSAAVWESGNNYWNGNWEIKYQNWVAKNWKPNFFMSPAKPEYNQIPHDCADAIYLMRATFAYEHNLPFKIHYLNKKGKYIENTMSNWDKLPQNQRFRAFASFMNDRVGTRSFANDSFPIALAQIKAGDLYTEPGTHSYAMTGITETGVTAIMSSTTPASPKNMIQLYSYPFFIPHDPVGMTDGYRRFKWPRNIDKPMQQQPGFSNEQYQIAQKVGLNYIPFTEEIGKRLRRREEPLEEKTMRLMHSLCSFAKERVNYVNDGLNKLNAIKASGRSCMNAKEYDYFSTPSRDKRLHRFFVEVSKIAYSGGQLTEDQVNAQVLARSIFHPDLPSELLKELDNFCGLAIYPNDNVKHINLRQLWETLNAGKVSSDPHAPFANRWGLTDQKFAGSCKTY